MKQPVLLLLIAISTVHAKVLIFTYAFNRPDFIEIQHITFEHLLEDEYEFVVFSDASNANNAHAIKNTCERLGIKHVRIPQEIHSKPYLERWPGENHQAPAIRNVNAVMYSLHNCGFKHDDILVLFDSDLFLVKKLSIRKLMYEHDIAAAQLTNKHVQYLWHGLCCLNLKKLPNINTLSLNCGRVNNKPIDAGGHSYYYLRDNPAVPVLYFNYFHVNHFRCQSCTQKEMAICTHNTELLKSKDFDNPLIEFLQNAHNVDFYHNASFLHYRGGTNWNGMNTQYHNRKTTAFKKFINAAIAS